MARVVLFHHALGLTDGVRAFADELRAAGHSVTAPDLFDGRSFEAVEDGVAYARELGFDNVIERGVAAAAGVERPCVAAGISLGVVPAQKLAQSEPGIAGAVLYHGAVPASEFGGSWPSGVALQIHLGERDPWAEEDLDAARELAESAGGDLFLYPTERHLVTDSSHADYDPEIAATIISRTLAMLEGVR